MRRCVICNATDTALAELPQYAGDWSHCRDSLSCATDAIKAARAASGTCPLCGRSGGEYSETVGECAFCSKEAESDE